MLRSTTRLDGLGLGAGSELGDNARAPVLLVSMGDPVGIGPECIVRAFHRGAMPDAVVVGSVAVMRRASASLGLSTPLAQLRVDDSNQPVSAWPLAPPGCLRVIQPDGLDPRLAELPWGQADARAGAAAARCIEWAVSHILRGQAEGLVTAPIHKAAWAAAGVHYPGHTEMLQALCTRGAAPPAVRMMLANDEIRVVLVTIHQSLRSAIDAISIESVLQTLRIVQASAPPWGIDRPRIGVAGLNPHAGEGGLFGDEELRIIGPAIQAARAEGIDARGPYAPDTVFMRARNTAAKPGEFDVVVAMTHDHGLIPVKYLGVELGVNVTLGLPILRTSPDHGTAFDIAGQAKADPRSTEAALAYARACLQGSSAA